MIVRLMGEGQYEVTSDVVTQLDGLDNAAVAASEAGNEAELDRQLEEMWRLVQSSGHRLPDDDLRASDAIIPPADLTLEETRLLFSDQGLVPDLPAPG